MSAVDFIARSEVEFSKTILVIITGNSPQGILTQTITWYQRLGIDFQPDVMFVETVSYSTATTTEYTVIAITSEIFPGEVLATCIQGSSFRCGTSFVVRTPISGNNTFKFQITSIDNATPLLGEFGMTLRFVKYKKSSSAIVDKSELNNKNVDKGKKNK